MRKIGAILGTTALAVVVFSTLPAAAFGIHLGRFYFHLPYVGHHYHRHHPMRANPNEARTRPNGRNAAEQADREARAETNREALESCIGLAPGVINLPIDQIRQTVHPTVDQEAALDTLSAASSQASEITKSSCPSSIPLTLIGRLDAAEQRLEATIKATRMVLSPLERFYEALGDEQRGRLNAMNGLTEGAHSPSDMAASAVSRRVPSSTCQRNASNRWFNQPRNSRAPSTTSRKQRRKWATNCNRPVRLRYRNRQ